MRVSLPLQVVFSTTVDTSVVYRHVYDSDFFRIRADFNFIRLAVADSIHFVDVFSDFFGVLPMMTESRDASLFYAQVLES